MKIRNNNQEIIKDLAKASYKYSKSRNRLMIGSIAIAVIIIFCIFSIMKGRIDAEFLSEVRFEGSNASTVLDYPTSKQIKQIRGLSYIDEVGSINYFARGKRNGEDKFVCLVADESAFNNIYLPAYSNIKGNYPKKDNEIMISIRGLEELGIKNPKLGMDIEIEIYMDKNKSDFQIFKLSGFYTDYVNPLVNPPIGFFNESYIKHLGFSMKEPTSLLIRQKSWYSWEDIEKKLYEDIETTDEVQKFKSEDSVDYNVIIRTIGGYEVAILAISLILLCVFLLNYNVMMISISKDIKYYGLLKTIGATNKQIRRIIYKQTFKIGCLGGGIGFFISFLVIKLILPKILSKYYLHNYGVSSNIVEFNLFFMLITILISFIILFISVLGSAKKVSEISAIESTKYLDTNISNKSYKNSNGDEIKIMAFRNVMRNRKSLIFTITSLFLGLTIGLISIVFTNALDITNNFELSPDFNLVALRYNPEWKEDYDSEYMSITNEDIDYLKSIDGIEKIDIISVDYGRLNSSEDIWLPNLKAEKAITKYIEYEDEKERAEYIRNNYYAIIVAVDESYIDNLEKYINENNINVDIEGLRNGTAAISTYGRFFSEKLLKSSESLIGEKFSIEKLDGTGTFEMDFGGYIDNRPEGFPEKIIPMKVNGSEIIVNEKIFKQYGLTKRPVLVDIFVNKDKEPIIKEKIKKFIKEKESELTPMEKEEKMFWYDINSDRLQEAQDEINTMKIIMYTVSILLIILGLVNYLNTVITNILSRRQEIAVLESIGITRKQLRKMLITEGITYSVIVSTLLITLGSGIIILSFKILKSNVKYAKFTFPYIPMVVIIIFLFIICVIVPIVIYKKMETESVIERLNSTNK